MASQTTAYQTMATIAAEIASAATTLAAWTSTTGTSSSLTDEQKSSNHDHRTWELESRLAGLVDELHQQVQPPQESLLELVATNWDQGALYALLEHNVLELLPDGRSRDIISVSVLAEETGVPPEKLLPMLRLAACHGFVREPVKEGFQHGVVSKALASDAGLKAFISFQLFETRVASAHLSDSLKKPNPTWTGHSAFKHAWGESMYDWHKSHPEKGARFKAAMQQVEFQLDPKSTMLEARLQESAKRHPGLRHRVVEISHLPTPNDCLVKLYPGASFVNYLLPSDVSDFSPPDDATIYHLHGALWNYPDDECVAILRVLAGILDKSPAAVLLVNDLLSPQPGTAPESHPDKVYRRRDVTVMTMHNAKIRTAQEWHALFLEAHPDFKWRSGTRYSSHACRGMWQLKLPGSHQDEDAFDVTSI